MRVIARPALHNFAERFPEAKPVLDGWWWQMRHNAYGTFAELRQHFRGVDSIGEQRYVFNLAGNRYRLVARIFFQTGLVYIRRVMTHSEYDRWNAEGRPD